MFQNLPFFENITFKEVDQLAENFALHLVRSGVKKGDRVAFRLPPSQETVALFFAIWKLRACVCPLSLRIPESQIEAHLSRLDAKCFIDSFPLSLQIRKPLYAPLPTPSALLFTSGSSGNPKIAVLALSSLLANAKEVVKALNLCPGDQWLLQLPLYHVGGIGIILRCHLAGASITLDPRKTTPTHVSAVPTQLYRSTPRYPHLKSLLIGGAPIASYPEKLPCHLSYGLTEMGSLVTTKLRPEFCEGRPILGFPLPGREVRLSAEGEIEVRGTCLFEGYWEGGTIHSKSTADGWFATGDLGSFSEQGLSILGRRDRQFISGGENIQPEEIEHAFLGLPGVIAALVFAQENPEYGHVPAAFLQMLPPFPTVASIQSALKERLPKFKIPLSILFKAELLNQGSKLNIKNFI